MARKILSDQDFGGISRIRNLPAPANADEPVRLSDLNSAVEGLSWKDSVRVASQVNVDLATPGAAINGITMAAGDRFLARNQTTTSQNGIYIWNGASTPATRSLDTSTAAELEQAVVAVEEGTDANTTWRQTSVNFVLGTDAVTFTSFAQSAPAATETTAGIAEIATQAETDTGTDNTRFVTPEKLANWASRTKRYQATFGDASATQFDITHNLNTRDVHVQVWETSGSYGQIECEVSALNVNTVRLNFASAPALNSLRAVIMA